MLEGGQSLIKSVKSTDEVYQRCMSVNLGDVFIITLLLVPRES